MVCVLDQRHYCDSDQNADGVPEIPRRGNGTPETSEHLQRADGAGQDVVHVHLGAAAHSQSVLNHRK